ncbi:MAG: tetratricopeptide repeat protein [Candidatus Kapabacteria bacterium]|nr:tetratricopeptide repeat protein [Candidatus Kapabacteria bacterium]
MQEIKDIEEIKTDIKKTTKIDFAVAIVPFIIAIILFALVWLKVETEVVDPWVAAIQKIDNSRTEKDEKKKKMLLDEGGKDLKDVMTKYPFHARVHFFMGYYFMNIGETDSAIFYLRNAINMGKGAVVNQVDAQAMTMISQVTLTKASKEIQSNNFAGAKKTLHANKMYNPADPNFPYLLGVCSQNLNEMDSAAYFYTKTLQIDPNHGPGKENLGNVSFMFGTTKLNKNENAEAEKDFRKAVELAPNFAQAFNNLGISLLRQNKSKDAIEIFERAVYLNPKEPSFKGNLEIAKKNSGISSASSIK